MSNKSETVSCRLPPQLLHLLDKARDKYGISRGEWIKAIVTNDLTDVENESIVVGMEECRQKIQMMEGRMQELEQSLARHLYLVLLQLGNLSPEEAKQFVKQKFLRQEIKNGR